MNLKLKGGLVLKKDDQVIIQPGLVIKNTSEQTIEINIDLEGETK